MKRVFMLSSQLLFSRGVENLLCQRSSVEIVGREADAARAIERIRNLKPDVVILDSKDLASAPSTMVMHILKEAPGTKVIALNLENEKIRVFRGEQHSAQCVDDLLAVIDEDSPAPSSITSEEWLSLAAGRAQVYGFLAAIYNRTIDDGLLDNLGANPIRFIGSLEKDNDLTGDLSEGLGALERFRLEVASRPREMVEAELAEEYARLFQGGASDDEFMPACEAMYTSLEAHGIDSICTALDKVYAEGGFYLSASPRSQPDFIGCELDFMQHLCSKECAAWTQADRHAALKYQALECAFLKDHLVRWVPRLCDVLLMRTKLDFYRGIMCMTKGFILNEAYRVVELMESDGPLAVTIAG